jgi:hypothetical protein
MAREPFVSWDAALLAGEQHRVNARLKVEP